jgi:hypothetical protein
MTGTLTAAALLVLNIVLLRPVEPWLETLHELFRTDSKNGLCQHVTMQKKKARRRAEEQTL